MLFRNFYDVIISLTKENVYLIQLNPALVPRDDTPQKFNAVANVLQLAVFRFISGFFRACVQKDTRGLPMKISSTGLSTRSCAILSNFTLL